MCLNLVKHLTQKPTVTRKDQAADCSILSHNLFEEASERNMQMKRASATPGL